MQSYAKPIRLIDRSASQQAYKGELDRNAHRRAKGSISAPVNEQDRVRSEIDLRAGAHCNGHPRHLRQRISEPAHDYQLVRRQTIGDDDVQSRRALVVGMVGVWRCSRTRMRHQDWSAMLPHPCITRSGGDRNLCRRGEEPFCFPSRDRGHHALAVSTEGDATGLRAPASLCSMESCAGRQMPRKSK
jgi:hypothetical protein